MSTQMEVDHETTATILSRISCVEPVLRTSSFVEKGSKLYINCFSGFMKKNVKRANLQKISDISSNQQIALLWTKYEHSYSKVYKAVDWGKSKEFYANKSCKGLFCKGGFMNSQLGKSEESRVQDSASSYTHYVNYNDDI